MPWIEDAIFAGWWMCVVIGCVMYLNYRARLSRAGQAAVPRPWGVRYESRFVLWAFAAMQLLQVPLGVYRTEVALHHPDPFSSGRETFWNLFPTGSILFLIVGIGLTVYDKYQASRDGWKTQGLCRRCGYDVRASRDRCPECGEPIDNGPGDAARITESGHSRTAYSRGARPPGAT